MPERLELECCEIDLVRREITREGKTTRLTQKDVALLAYQLYRLFVLVECDVELRALAPFAVLGVTRSVEECAFSLVLT